MNINLQEGTEDVKENDQRSTDFYKIFWFLDNLSVTSTVTWTFPSVTRVPGNLAVCFPDIFHILTAPWH